MKRIFLFILLVIAAFGMRAQEAAYTISLPEAVWNFDDYEGPKPSVSSNSYLVPQNWIIGNGGSSKKLNCILPFYLSIHRRYHLFVWLRWSSLHAHLSQRLHQQNGTICSAPAHPRYGLLATATYFYGQRRTK